jgi:hypothetical protein
MDMFEQFLFDIKADFLERKISAQVFGLDSYDVVLIFIGKDFLDMFHAQDCIIVADEPLSPCWRKYLYDNLDGFPCWVAQVKYKMVERNCLIECLNQMEKAMAFHRRRIKN